MEGEVLSRRVRIHVGGLGESVSKDDISNLFSKVGFGFDSVDIIKTKGRCFAYIDFVPSSSNSLPKLFTTYNGCVWKGGKLRLEKAKEHFLDRLKREWTEDAQLASSTCSGDVNAGADKRPESLEKPKKDLSFDKKQLLIYFPRLQKLKSIPFSGTGKHKYSFRRVEVPSLPTHFCDCEEHSGSLYAAPEIESHVPEEQCGGMNQGEIDMMNSVMSRLFEMENVLGASHSEIELTKVDDHSIKPTDDLQLDESEGCYSTEDEDDLIINVVSQRKQTAFTDQEPKLNKRKASDDRPTQVLKEQSRNNEENNTSKYVSAISRGKGNLQAPSSGPGAHSGAQLIKSQSSVKQSTSSASWSQKSSWRELVGDRSNSAITLCDTLPGFYSSKAEETKSDAVQNSNERKGDKLLKRENQRGHLEESEVEGLAEAQHTKLDFASDKAGRGSAWLHKASWTQLIASSNSSSFSITQILPGVTFEKQEPVKSDGGIITDSRDCKHDDNDETGKTESLLDGMSNIGIQRDGGVKRTLESSQLIGTDSIKTSVLTGNKNNSATKQKGCGIAIGETHPFMRTEESVKEWANIRAALSGSRKRTNKGK